MLKSGKKTRSFPSRTPSRSKRAKIAKCQSNKENTDFHVSQDDNVNEFEIQENTHSMSMSTPSTSKTPLKDLNNSNNSNYSFLSDSEYQSIMDHELEIQKEPLPRELDANKIIQGNRIVQLGWLLKWAIPLQYNHAKKCTSGMLYVDKEIRKGLGLVSYILFKCTVCDDEIMKCTEDPNRPQSVINNGAIWGTVGTGSTYAHTEELMSCMDIPSMNKYIYYKIERELQEVWHSHIFQEMQESGEEEKRLAIEKGDVDPDNIPFITVYLDAGWSKRSYGHNYNAASGVGAIIGKETGKLLFLGVRNKYCMICARAANKNTEAKSHICFRNYYGSSASMEADIIVEGFCQSEEIHGLRYKKFIADGDSSTFSNIISKVPYGRSVTKIECANHAIKNYGKYLHNLKKDKTLSSEAKKQLKNETISLLQKVAQSAIYNCALEKQDGTFLKKELSQGIHHVFKDHTSCREYYCTTIGDVKESQIYHLKTHGLYRHLFLALEILLKKSSLIDNETNNRAELFMNILARFNAGKRLNLIGRGSFQSRCHLTALRYDKGIEWHIKPYQERMSFAPGLFFKKYIDTQKKEHDKKRAKALRQPQQRTSRKRTSQDKMGKLDYGPHAKQVEPTEDEIKELKNIKLDNLKVTEEQRNVISELTVGQFENHMYISERNDRLTASNFGAVMNRRKTTRCHSLVHQILYSGHKNLSHISSISYGKKNELVALQKLEEKLGCKVQPAGLFIDHEKPFLAASPDGLIGDTHCVEVKCLPSVLKSNLTLEEATIQKKTCLEMKDGKMRLKRNHQYYYQVQGQLNITKRDICYFVVYVAEQVEIFFEKIKRDEILWREKMAPTLEIFYMDCVLEEIIRQRSLRNEKCYDPPWIEEAIESKTEKK